MDSVVLPAIERCSTEGWMEPAKLAGVDGDKPQSGSLHYVCYDSAKFSELQIPGAIARFRGTVVISHGFTEFAGKYAEFIWYLLLEGYSVCFLEHRGHGLSARDVDNPSLVWIDDWRRYVADLAKFSHTIAKPMADGHPFYIFGHSMGGGIAAALLQSYPTLFDRAVLSCPMIAPNTGSMPAGLAFFVSSVMCDVGMGKKPVRGYPEFSTELDLTQYPHACANRVRWFHGLRCKDWHYETYAPTYSWVREAMRLSRALLDPARIDRIETPILMFQAELDQWVQNSAQDVFVTELRDHGGNVEVELLKGSPHELLITPNAIMEQFLSRMFDYLDASEPAMLASTE